jgi:hypothetical protein
MPLSTGVDRLIQPFCERPQKFRSLVLCGAAIVGAGLRYRVITPSFVVSNTNVSNQDRFFRANAAGSGNPTLLRSGFGERRMHGANARRLGPINKRWAISQCG